MIREKKFPWGGAALAVAAIAVALWIGIERQTSSAQDAIRPTGPLISRGFTEAPAGTAVIAGDPAGGSTILELRVKDGQTVKRDEIIAVLSNYPQADVGVRTAEATLEKIKQIRETMLTGSRVTEIAMQEASIRTTIESNRLNALQRQRSGRPPDQKEIEISLDEQNLEAQRATLRLQKQSLATDLAMNAIDIANAQASLDSARRTREETLVRSPLDGVVVQVFARQGERISAAGIAKVVDMSQLRVLASVDELHLARIRPGARVEITFKGDPVVYGGRILRMPLAVKRVVRSDADLGEMAARLVEIEIEPDDAARLPQFLGREARVTFLN
jgi:multidrug efflux pump subunit AcrA (membrane-fusion protein)